ncbi:HAD-IIA family hydrolase [Agromyces archimandritae]|uniref:HAD-IIA family hydrolase n=1 Tax=Agromyces archimandritae TaxID=2781962 RepID=A0A975IP77_9MICO|nr:HAD-IIA family hydrolase [Agromyces archimandritae]QTX04984.1 HAD-IIA family hydrolase [Agromyces archimandritae]
MALFRTKTEGEAPIAGADAILADLDGVVYRGAGAIPFAVASLNRAAAAMPVGYLTNNAARSDASVAAHLVELGLRTEPRDVVTSPQAAMRLLRAAVPEGATVLVVGGEGIVVELERAGYRPTRSADDGPAAVVQGFAPDVAWTQLAEASFALRPGSENGTGIPWIATNMDWTIPVARGIAPGNGTLVSAVHTAVGRFPEVAGKPETPIFAEAAERFGARTPLMIGDRLDTDILGASRAGIRSAVVLTGIDRAKQLLAAEAGMRPDFILADLRGLHEPYPLARAGRNGEVRVGDARVRLEGSRIAVVADGDPLDRLRAACTVIWESGRPIHTLEVPPELYGSGT